MSDTPKTDPQQVLDELRASDPALAEAQDVVETIRQAGDTLERMRERAGLSQTAVAEALDFTPARVSQLESGTLRHAPSLKTMARYARVCGDKIDIVLASERAAQRAETSVSKADFQRLVQEIAALREKIEELQQPQSMIEPWRYVEPTVGADYGAGTVEPDPRWRLPHHGSGQPGRPVTHHAPVGAKRFATIDYGGDMIIGTKVIDPFAVRCVELTAQSIFQAAGGGRVTVRAEPNKDDGTIAMVVTPRPKGAGV